MICGTNKLLAILEAADEMNMMKKALPFCKQMGSAFLMQRRKGLSLYESLPLIGGIEFTNDRIGIPAMLGEF